MTPLQELSLLKLKATAQANLEFFRLNFPLIHKQIGTQPPEATIDISDQGDLTIRYPDGSSLSVAEHYIAMEQQLEKFREMESRPQLLGFRNLRLVQKGDEIGHGRKQRFHYSNLDAEFPNRVRRHYVKHYPAGCDGLVKYPDFGKKHIPILIVVGSGLGWHLTRILMEYDVTHLMVIETDVEAFRLSLFFQDYVELSRLAIEKKTSLSFTIESDIDQLTATIVRLVQVSLPPAFVHGAGVFYQIQDKSVRAVLNKTLPVALWQLFFGLGYFDDELISLKHSFQNLENHVPLLSRVGMVPENAVAFVIGSGPSLDELMPLLREVQDRAVIFSCGTALGPLSHAGIKPDFHVEKERPCVAYEILTETIDKSFLEQIDFIGVNVIHPDVFGLFRRAMMVLKSSDSAADLLRREYGWNQAVVDVQPTVTNAALNLAIKLGFKTVYLAGVDFGYLDKERHHSQHTVYLDKLPKDGPLAKLFSNRARHGQLTVQGNFGGEVVTTSILNVARTTMESTLENDKSGASVYNLNRGARIHGTIPLPASEFACDVSSAEKSGTLGLIRDAFEVKDYDIPYLGQKLLSEIDAFMEEIETVIGVALSDKRQALASMVKLYKLIFSIDYVGKPVNVLFRGSLLHIMMYSYQMLSTIKDEGEAAAKVQYDYNVMREFLVEARKEVASVFGKYA